MIGDWRRDATTLAVTGAAVLRAVWKNLTAWKRAKFGEIELKIVLRVDRSIAGS